MIRKLLTFLGFIDYTRPPASTPEELQHRVDLLCRERIPGATLELWVHDRGEAREVARYFAEAWNGIHYRVLWRPTSIGMEAFGLRAASEGSSAQAAVEHHQFKE